MILSNPNIIHSCVRFSNVCKEINVRNFNTHANKSQRTYSSSSNKGRQHTFDASGMYMGIGNRLPTSYT